MDGFVMSNVVFATGECYYLQFVVATFWSWRERGADDALIADRWLPNGPVQVRETT